MRKAHKEEPSTASLRDMPEVVNNPRFVRVGPRGAMARRMGRPRKGVETEGTVPTTIRIPESVLVSLTQFANERHATVSAVLRHAVELFARRIGASSPRK